MGKGDGLAQIDEVSSSTQSVGKGKGLAQISKKLDPAAEDAKGDLAQISRGGQATGYRK